MRYYHVCHRPWPKSVGCKHAMNAVNLQCFATRSTVDNITILDVNFPFAYQAMLSVIEDNFLNYRYWTDGSRSGRSHEFIPWLITWPSFAAMESINRAWHVEVSSGQDKRDNYHCWQHNDGKNMNFWTPCWRPIISGVLWELWGFVEVHQSPHMSKLPCLNTI